MNTEDDEFNRIEREASLRKAAVLVAITKKEWTKMPEEEIKGIFSYHGQQLTGRELALIRVIEALFKRNT
jgi:hypothetical protein